MKRVLFYMNIMVCMAFIMTSVSFLYAKDEVKDNVAPEGFTALFNGEDLTGWVGMGHKNPYDLDKMTAEQKTKFFTSQESEFKKHWSVENGELVNDGKGPYATTVKDYKNFELLIDYRTVAKADSGVYLRATPQVQIWDYTKEGGKWNIGADKGSGGLWNNQKNMRDPLVMADKPFGEWNSLRIIIKGDKVSVWLNGQQTVDNVTMENFWNRSIPLREVGPIQLQTHGGEIRWKNIFIKEITE